MPLKYAEPLREYNGFLDHLKSHGYARDEFTRIPLNLIDLAAAVLASMITGRELSLFGSHMYHQEQESTMPSHHAPDIKEQQQQHREKDRSTDSSLNDESDIFYFIQRILKRTQLSCTTLVLALIYIDRFKARLALALKRRTRLDQGPDYKHIFTPKVSSLGQQPLPNNDLLPSESTASPSSSSTAHSPASIMSTPSPQSSSSRSIDTNTHVNSNHKNRHSSKYNSSHTSKRGQEPWSSISLFLVAVICADKYLFDATFSNAEWADFSRGRYSTQELNDLERRFLGHLQYKLYVSEPEFDGFLSYLEVVLALKQVWGRGLVTFSYSDVRILTQQLMPAYADRLHFRTLQGDMMAVLWQVMSTLSRLYLAIAGTFIVAAAGYTAITELSHMARDSPSISSLNEHHNTPLRLDFIHLTVAQTWPCVVDRGPSLAPQRGQAVEQGNRDVRIYDEEPHHSIMQWALAPSTMVRCATVGHV
ncbi:hypothetical protein EDD11_007206 [Mortierella claussenii]|nr:hypothetical protein EDD11_007206 [Mortierella claussenii]